MNIGFDAKRIFHNASGLGQYGRYIATHLHRLYPDERYIMYAAKKSDRYPLKSGQSFHPLSFPAWYRRSVDMRSLWQKDNIDVFHGLSNELPLVSSQQIKTVVTIHDILFEDFPQDYSSLDRSIYRLKTKRALENAQTVIAISEVTKHDLVERYGADPDRIHVIYQSCRPEFFHRPAKETIDKLRATHDLLKPFILCVSSFSHRKDQEVLIRAYAESGLQEYYDLVLVGAPSGYRDKVRQLSTELGIGKYVKWPVLQDDQDVVKAYYGCDLVVYPSRKEGFGIPVIEGMAAGKAVVVRQNTSCHEAGGEAVSTFDGSSHDLANVMVELLENSPRKQDFIQKGKKRVERFDPKSEMTKLMAIYKK